jgi:hypothetical protein
MEPKRFKRGKHQYTKWGDATEVRAMPEPNIPEAPPQVQLQVDADDATAQGVYANLAGVMHTETEFVLDFLFLQPNQPRAKLRSRVLSSPVHTKRLLAALADNIRKYEDRFGPIPDHPAHPRANA